MLARQLGQHIGTTLGQTVVVENRPGASGNIGASYVTKADVDNYTIFLETSTALSVNQSLYKKLPYDAQPDFKPVVLATMLPSIVVVGKDAKVNTLQELNQSLKAGATNGSHASLHVPYSGARRL